MAVGGGVGKLLISIGLKSTVKADGKRVERETGAIAKGIEKKGLMIGAGMTAVGVGAKLMADNINKSYLTFDSAMAEVKSLGGVTAEQMEIMRSSAMGISKELPLSAQNVAGGFYMMRSAGFDAARVIEELPAIAEMAVAGNLEMADAVNATTMVLDTYGERAGSAEDITNVLMGTVQAFKTTLPELQMQLSKNIGVAANLGISFGELAAMSGMMKKEFVGSEEAGSAMKTMLLRLVDPNVITQLESMNIKVKDNNGDFIGMQSVLDSLSVKLDEAGGEVEQMTILQELFGAEGVRAAMVLIRQKDELRAYTDAVNSGTSVQEALNAVLESTQSQLDIANNKMEAAKITMGEAMAPATILAAEAMATFAGTIEGMPKSLQTVIGSGIQFSKVFMGIGPLLMGLSAVYPIYASSQFAATIATMGLTSATWAFTVALLANPLTWIVVGIMALVAVIVLLEKKFGFVTKAIKTLTKWFKRTGKDAEDATEKVETSMTEMAKAAGKVTEALGTPTFESLLDQMDELGKKETLIRDAVSAMAELSDPIKQYELALKDAESAEKELDDAIKATGDLKPEVDKLRGAYEDLERAMRSITDLNEGIEDQGRAIEHAQFGLEDAQGAYNKAVEEYGEDSKEAAKADLKLRDAKDRLDDAQKRQKDMEEELGEAIETKGEIEKEYNVDGLTELENLLDAKQTEYNAALLAEETARNAHKLINDAIALAEANEQIAQWKNVKEYIEGHPAEAKIEITKYIKTVSEASTEGSMQHGGAIPKTGLYLLHKDEYVVPASATAPSAASAIPTVHQEFTIYNYSDIENLERNIAEAINRGIHNKYSMR